MRFWEQLERDIFALKAEAPGMCGACGKDNGIAAGATERVNSGPKPIETGKRQPVLLQIVNPFSLPYLERVHVGRVASCNRGGRGLRNSPRKRR
jgi:hypothetical protein